MFITIASFKGGVSKSTTAFHISAALSKKDSTLLIDGDKNRQCLIWASRGDFPFEVCPEEHGARLARNYHYIVTDTEARPNTKDFKQLLGGCDLLIIPVPPEGLAFDATLTTIQSLPKGAHHKTRLLITKAPKRAYKKLKELTDALKPHGIVIFKESIPLYAAFDTAFQEGLTVNKVKNKYALPAWKSYVQLTKEILAYEQQIFRNSRSKKRATR